MLRFAIVALVVVNVAYYGWTQGALARWGWDTTTHQESEAYRLGQQIAPEMMELPPAAAPVPQPTPAPAPAQPAPDAAAAPATAAAATPAVIDPAVLAAAQPAGAAANTVSAPMTGGVCWVSGVLDEAQLPAVRTALKRVPQDGWSLTEAVLPGRWMVFMGRFTDQDTLEKKKSELRGLKIAFDRVNNPELGPGLSLGRFINQESADRELAHLSKQGVRTARVVQERPETKGYLLRLPHANDAMKPVLHEVRSAIAPKLLKPCTP